MPSHNITSITLPAFNAVLARYPAAVPDSLRALDTQRYVTIPAAVAARVDAHLSKEEVIKLVEWKLYVCFNFCGFGRVLIRFGRVGNMARFARNSSRSCNPTLQITCRRLRNQRLAFCLLYPRR
jgi:hypothetical protein